MDERFKVVGEAHLVDLHELLQHATLLLRQTSHQVRVDRNAEVVVRLHEARQTEQVDTFCRTGNHLHRVLLRLRRFLGRGEGQGCWEGEGGSAHWR